MQIDYKSFLPPGRTFNDFEVKELHVEEHKRNACGMEHEQQHLKFEISN